METTLDDIFGKPLIAVLAKRGFVETSRYQSDGWIAVDFANEDFGIQLVYEMHGKYVNLMPLADLKHHYSIEWIIEYLGGDVVEGDKLAADAHFLDERYIEIRNIFGRDDGGVTLQIISNSIYVKNAKQFHYDRIADST